MAIVSQPANQNYRAGWEKTFGKKEKPPSTTEVCGMTYCSDGNASGHNGAEFSTCGRPRGHEDSTGDRLGSKCGRGPA
jgi:hypothetical protein